jgi:hypothetical protein
MIDCIYNTAYLKILLTTFAKKVLDIYNEGGNLYLFDYRSDVADSLGNVNFSIFLL